MGEYGVTRESMNKSADELAQKGPGETKIEVSEKIE